MSDSISVLIIDGDSHPNIPLRVARCLAQVRGIKLRVLTHSRFAWIRLSRHVRTSVLPTGGDKQQRWLDGIQQAVEGHPDTILFPVSDEAIRFVATHHATLRNWARIIPVPTLEAFDTVMSKWKLSESLDSHQIATPPTILCQAGPKFDREIREIGFPVLLKPIYGSFGRGILRFETRQELWDYLQLHGSDCYDQFIVQSFTEGYDIDCSVLCSEGRILAYTIQKGFVYGKETFACPAGIIFEHNDQVLSAVQQWAAALRWTGVAHADLRYDEQDQTMKMIEVNPRYWSTVVGSQKAGVNFPHLCCLTALGHEFEVPRYRNIAFVKYTELLNRDARSGHANGRLTLANTDFSLVMADPLPELSKSFAKPFQRLLKGFRRPHCYDWAGDAVRDTPHGPVQAEAS